MIYLIVFILGMIGGAAILAWLFINAPPRFPW